MISCLFSSIGADISFEEYEENYPVYDQQKANDEAQSLAKSKFSPIERGTVVEITTKIGERIKGKYWGINTGNITIGTRSVSWIDVPDNKKYLFSEDECKKLREGFASNYLIECKNKYLAKKSQDVIDYKKNILTTKNAIELADGNILHSAEIIKKTPTAISIKYNNRVIDLKYTQLSESSRKLIKSEFGFTTVEGITYNDVQVIGNGVSTLNFYNDKGEIEVVSFSNLPEKIQSLFGYSLEKENAYNKDRIKHFEISSAVELKSLQEHAAMIYENKRKERQNSWIQYIHVCGKAAQYENLLKAKQVFNEKYINNKICWDGEVVSIGEYEDESRTGSVIEVKMTPTESVFSSDVSLIFLNNNLYKELLKLKKGNIIKFEGLLETMPSPTKIVVDKIEVVK